MDESDDYLENMVYVMRTEIADTEALDHYKHLINERERAEAKRKQSSTLWRWLQAIGKAS